MQIKEIKPINFLFFRTETKIQELVQFLPVGQELYREAVNQELTITGPVSWHYFGFAGDPSKAFTLEIALAVGAVPQEYDGRFHFKRTSPFRCASVIHDGGWTEIPAAYEKLFRFIATQRLTPSNQNREIYINVDLADPEANVTEVQLGVM